MMVKIAFPSNSDISDLLVQETKRLLPVKPDFEIVRPYDPNTFQRAIPRVGAILEIERVLEEYQREELFQASNPVQQGMFALITHQNGYYSEVGWFSVDIGDGRMIYTGRLFNEKGFIVVSLQNNRNDRNNAKLFAHLIAHKYLARVRPENRQLSRQAHCNGYISRQRCIMNLPENLTLEELQTVYSGFCRDCRSDISRAASMHWD